MATKPLQEMAPQVGFEQEPAEIKQMRTEYQAKTQTFADQIKAIEETPMSVDTGALVGEIQKGFEATKGRIVESALSAVKKTGMEMDTYFGGASGDQRSGARIRMASAVKNQLMQSAFQTIAGLYDNNVKQVVSTELEGAKTNIQGAAAKAAAIAQFTGQATQMYLGVLGAVNDNYQARLAASVKWAEIQATARGQDIAASLQREQMKSSEKVSLLTSRNTPWWVKRELAPPPTAEEQYSSPTYRKVYV